MHIYIYIEQRFLLLNEQENKKLKVKSPSVLFSPRDTRVPGYFSQSRQEV